MVSTEPVSSSKIHRSLVLNGLQMLGPSLRVLLPAPFDFVLLLQLRLLDCFKTLWLIKFSLLVMSAMGVENVRVDIALQRIMLSFLVPRKRKGAPNGVTVYSDPRHRLCSIRPE